MFRRLSLVGDRALLYHYTSSRSKTRSVVGAASRRYEVALASRAVQNVDYGSTTPSGWNRDENNRHTLLNMIHQGEYERVLTVWESEKELNKADTALYTVVMAMCERMKSAELACAVKDDMERQNLIMEPQCRILYIRTLLSDDGVSDALDFVRSIHHPDMKDRKSFLLECVKTFQEYSHVEEAVAVCDLYTYNNGGSDSGSGRGIGRSVELDAIKIECLGELGQSERLSLFVKEHYGDASKYYQIIRTAVTNGLAMIGDMESALALLKASSHQKVVPKTLALLLECAVRTQSLGQGVLLWYHFWEESTDLTAKEFADISSDRSTYLLRAVNAALHLQALIYKDDLAASCGLNQEVKAVMEKFIARDLLPVILENKLIPNASTLESVMLLSCFNERAFGTTERVVKSMVRNGQKLDPKSFTKWVRECGTLSPFAVEKVFSRVRMLVHGYSVPMGYSESEHLLSVLQGDNNKDEAAKNVLSIKRLMKSNNLLEDITGWNILLTGYMRAKSTISVRFTLQDIAENGLKLNLATFKVLADGASFVDEYKYYMTVVYKFWRLFNQDCPELKPDIEFINKMLHCCRKCRNLDRGFYFFDVAEEHGLNPDINTFREILLMCNDSNEKEEFHAILEKAHKCLPSEKMILDALQSNCNLKWKAEVDVELATSIITNSARKQTSLSETQPEED